jgi:Asp-tRNA(Asn)/Glu-tRNA(Gln) amidotransferase A subunit family amidase
VAVPTGLSNSGLPLSMQIIGKPFDEARVYQIAHAYEQATGFGTQIPDLG